MATDFLDINIIVGDDESKEARVLERDVDLFFQELTLLFQFSSIDIYSYGSELPNLKQYIFSKWISNNRIKADIMKSVSENCYHSSFFQWNLEINLLKDNSNKDILHLVFSVWVPSPLNRETKSRVERQFLIGF
jgi:hypothetical protein